jgi:hypothetical protein
MNYDLAKLYWQQFEVLSLKCLIETVSSNIQFIDGGSDKGREMLYLGSSREFRDDLNGKWIFQCKHKSGDLAAARSSLKSDLKKELEKVYLKNSQKSDNYILVTNIPTTGDLLDDLQEIFDTFIKDNPGTCSDFGIFSYRNFETILDKSPKIIWQFPNILSHPDFERLFNHPFQKITDTRTRGWLKGVAERRNFFVHTEQTAMAIESLEKNNIIILSGPPKSGKTFNAEMLALYYVGKDDYEAIKIDDPDDVEKFYIIDKKQIFICDDAFGSHSLSYKDADDWNRKLETIFNLSNDTHKFIFSSRENIYNAFKNYAKDFAESFLPKTTISSEKLSDAEKGAILERYIQLSNLEEEIKREILNSEENIVKHPKFSPETVRAFFKNYSSFQSVSITARMFDHLEKPDDYLRSIFFNLNENSKAAVLSVLCALESDYQNVQKKFAQIREDLNINTLKSTVTEFDELDGAIIKLIKGEEVEQVDFYHPSMQEFLIREIEKDKHGALRKIILKNLNTTLINQFILGSPNIKPSKKELKAIEINVEDVKLLKDGLERIIENDQIRLYNVIPFIKWLSDAETGNSKIFAKDLFAELKDLVGFIYISIFTEAIYRKLKDESSVKWMNFLLVLKTLELVTGGTRPDSVKNVIIKLIDDKKNDLEFWCVALLGNVFLEEDKFNDVVGQSWLESFREKLISDINTLGRENYGNYFPDNLDEYRATLRKAGKTEKLQTKKNWYPTFLVCQTKVKLLKLAKSRAFNNKLLFDISKEWNILMKISQTAKNRHNFNVSKRWW